MTTDLPPDVRDRAARAAYDAINDVAWGQPGSDRHFKVAIVGWRAVVDAVAEVITEHLAAERDKTIAGTWTKTGNEFVGDCGNASPSNEFRMNHCLNPLYCTLPAGHQGWHQDSESGGRWGKPWTDTEEQS